MKCWINIAVGSLCLLGGLSGCMQDPTCDESSFDSPETRVAKLGATNYYWYRGQQIGININPEKRYILLEGTTPSRTIAMDVQFIEPPSNNTLSGNIKPILTSDGTSSVLQTEKALSWAIVTSVSVSNRTDIRYNAPCFTSMDGEDLALSHLFYVKLKSYNDVDKLISMASEYNVEILGNNEYMPLWYTLSCTNASNGNALDIANRFYESGNFQSCQPCFVSNEDDTTSSYPNDPLFSTQWGLNNTGQHGGTAGIDINILDAHTVTSGDGNVIVAVLDHGTQLNHPDLNICTKSYDTETGKSPSVVRGDHGTACSGIISGKMNNGLGITGIAPDCPIMSISNNLVGSSDAPQKRADGFNYAWRNGAAVISNSWKSSSYSELLEDAIQSAIDNGRGGLGCIVVFSAGNDNSGIVGYPARSLPDILTVGALCYNGMRKSKQSIDGEYWWGSNYGTQLDVMAPGIKIPTTDRTGSAGYDSGDYVSDFNGTSSACPHVAAVAALVLSVNPELTQREVCDIIEQGARKMPSYVYSTVSGRPNGTWNNETGYGLVDAYAAVLLAQDFETDPDLILENREFHTSMSFVADGRIYIDHVTVNPGCTLNLKAGLGVEISDSFEMHTDATLIIQNV